MHQNERPTMKDVRLQESHYVSRSGRVRTEVDPKEYKQWKEAIEEYMKKTNLLFLSHKDYFEIIKKLGWINVSNENKSQ